MKRKRLSMVSTIIVAAALVAGGVALTGQSPDAVASSEASESRSYLLDIAGMT